jgi:hypothetical protein
MMLHSVHHDGSYTCPGKGGDHNAADGPTCAECGAVLESAPAVEEPVVLDVAPAVEEPDEIPSTLFDVVDEPAPVQP